jgi:hypothetical protein
MMVTHDVTLKLCCMGIKHAGGENVEMEYLLG